VNDRLPAGLVERVLEKLGFASAPDPDRTGLGRLYEAWCRDVPFDNVRKMIWLREEIPGPLPGDDAQDFFEAWLAHGTGGTCWAGNGALHALLRSLGFETRRGYATMMAAPDIPPNHGTVVVDPGDGPLLLVDASVLFGEPLPLVAGAAVEHPGWGVRLREDEDGKLRLAWRAFHADPFDCRIEATDADRETFSRFHEVTRAWSPFNYSLSARRNVDHRVIGASFGRIARLEGTGPIAFDEEPSRESRKRLLVDELGISEEMADRLPEDLAMPPPPGRG
jgi:N-hydroxyarylamine O-acetyltransferase